MKKKTIVSIILFCAGFAVTYLILCYLPSLRIKLAADPMEYFIASIGYMVLFKGMVSFVVGMILAILPQIKKNSK